MTHCSKRLRARLLAALAPSFLCGAVLAGEPVPTVIVDISGIGAGRLQALKDDPSVRWSAEFGTEMLLGIAPEAQADWLARERVRDGVGRLATDEIWIRDHVCAHQALQPALAVVGGFEVLRMPPSAVRYGALSGMVGNPLPADGVVAREVANSDAPRSVLGADPALQAIVDQVDAERWFQTMSLLAGFNRNSYSAALGPARDWILSAFEGAQLTSSIFPYTLVNGCTGAPAVDIDNPIGTKAGSSLPDEWIVVGAHYDSRNSVRCDGAANPQPGANDNASGCAGVIELARVFANVPTERSILFMCFSGEEQGLVGSRRYVESLTASGDIARVKHMINLDMIGFDPSGTLDARVDTNAANVALLAQYVGAATTYAPELNLITSGSTSANTDHWYFLAAGVPAVFTWENGASIYPHYHQSTDIPANMTRARELAGGILKMDAAMLATVAGIVPRIHEDGFE